MRIVDCEQGSGEWLEVRTGKVTASEIASAVHFLKRKSGDRVAGESSGTRESYKAALLAEIMTGQANNNFVSKWMERGTALESTARTEYELRYGVMVEKVGFILHPTIDRSGASPDGLIVGERGGLEIKVPKIETHLGYMFAGVLPPEYKPQVHWNIACSELDWWDFISFCPDLPERHQIFKVRVNRDDAYIAELEAGVLQVLAEVDEMIARLDELNPYIAPAPQEQPSDEFADCLLSDADLDAFFGKQGQQ